MSEQVLRIVFDGPPGHEGGRFVEVENERGESINAGEWREINNGLWELRIDQTDELARARQALHREEGA